MACCRFVPTRLASLHKERERTLVGKPTLSGYLELGMFDDAALALEYFKPEKKKPGKKFWAYESL